MGLVAERARIVNGPVGSAQWRTVELPVRGQQNCPVVARCSARSSVGQWRHPHPHPTLKREELDCLLGNGVSARKSSPYVRVC